MAKDLCRYVNYTACERGHNQAMVVAYRHVLPSLYYQREKEPLPVAQRLSFWAIAPGGHRALRKSAPSGLNGADYAARGSRVAAMCGLDGQSPLPGVIPNPAE
jgi:hypothetical protein